jgi:hypothetical protein
MSSLNSFIKKIVAVSIGVFLAIFCSLYSLAVEENNISNSVFKISREIEKIRNLKFKSPVVVETQTIEALNSYIEKQILHEFGEDKGRGYITALVILGALKEYVELSTVYSTLARSQVSAHYDPYSHKYYLIMTNLPPDFIEIISSHELSHALQDQNFNLKEFLDSPASNIRQNADKALARQCVVEGEATLIMVTWFMMKNKENTNPEDVTKETSLAVSMMASINPESLIELPKTQTEKKNFSFPPDITEMLQGLDDLPLFFVYTLYSSYAQGAYMVNYLKTQGGWERINKLYKHPPVSTEQILHPEKLLDKTDEPLDVTLDEFSRLLPASWICKEENTLGELGIIALLQLWLNNADVAKTGAEGWGGDRYGYFTYNNSEKYLLVWKILWDTEKDATEFSVAYQALLKSRFPKLKKIALASDSQRITQTWEVEPSRILKLSRKGKEILVLDSNDSSIIKLLDK